MKLIIFTTCKPFIDDDAWRQEQAIKSWTLLEGIEKKIIIIGNDKGTKEICEKYNLIHESIVRNLDGVPYLYSMFEIANKYAKENDVLLWTNADMIYFNHIIDIIINFKQTICEKNYLLIGRRIDWFNPTILDSLNYNTFKNNINMNKETTNKITKINSDKYECALHAMCGIDYVIHSKSTFVDKLDKNLVIAGWRHDMILVGVGIHNNIFTCNISDVNPCIHQNHDYIGNNKSKPPSHHNKLWVNNQRCLGIQRSIHEAPFELIMKENIYVVKPK